jgi:hypothetical protein
MAATMRTEADENRGTASCPHELLQVGLGGLELIHIDCVHAHDALALG